MKIIKTIVITAVSVAILFGSISAKKGRKLPIGAYIKSAKIEILSGDLERYKTATALLDSLHMHYGPHAEAIFWMGKIEVDYIEKASSPVEKKPHVDRFVAYIDSLHICCDKDNKDVKKKYKKNCDDYIEQADSISVKFWREFYNAAVEQMKTITDLKEDVAQETDSSVIERFNNDIKLNVDSAATNFKLALTLDDSKQDGYVGLGLLYEKVQDYENAIKWLDKGLAITEDRQSLLIQIAYDYINMGDYHGSIPYMREYIEIVPEDTLTMSNLVICYNNNKMYDSAYSINQRILGVSADNFEALKSLGLYYGQLSRNANDSAVAYSENETEKKKWNDIKFENIDSAIFYFKRAINSNSEDERLHELYGTYTYIKGDYQEAANSFAKLAELQPSVPEFWTSLGDCSIQLKDFKAATVAYEKTVELEPDNKAVWEQLVDLYGELGRKKDQAAAEKKVSSL